MSQEIPYIIYAEETPNPSTIKFVANKMLLLDGATAQYWKVDEAKGSPLALALFEFPFVKQVFISGTYVAVTKVYHEAWEDIILETRVFITEFLNKGNAIVNELPVAEMALDNTFTETKKVFTEHSAPSNEVEVKIIEILEQYIRPAVEQDGGLITFKSLVEGKVTVQMRGACSGCPSSTLTLKAGIEALLKRLMPDQITEVVSEAF